MSSAVSPSPTEDEALARRDGAEREGRPAFSRHTSVEHGMTQMYSSTSLHTIPESSVSPSRDSASDTGTPPPPRSSHARVNATTARAQTSQAAGPNSSPVQGSSSRRLEGGAPPSTAAASEKTSAPDATRTGAHRPPSSATAQLHVQPPSSFKSPGPTARFRSFQTAPVCVSDTSSARDWVRISVGGTVFTTTLMTLCADPDSMLCAMCAPLMHGARTHAQAAARAAQAAARSPSSLASSAPVTKTGRGFRGSTRHVDPTADSRVPETPPSFTTPSSSLSSPLATRGAAPTVTAVRASSPAEASTAGGVHAVAASPMVHPHPSHDPATSPTPVTTTTPSVAGGGESISPHVRGVAAVTHREEDAVLPLDTDAHNSLLLDLDPEYFAPILNYLRHNTLLIPATCNPRGVLAAATYLNVKGVVEQLTARPRPMPQYLFSWGSGSSGELGTQRLVNSDVPTPARMTPFGVRVSHVALGANYSLVLSDRGEVYGVGNADWGQLGLGNPKLLDVNPTNHACVQLVPRRIPLFEQTPALTIAAGYAFAMAIAEGHHVYFWGNNNHAQGGLGAAYLDAHFKKIDSPCLVETLEGKEIVQVGCGSFFGLARSASGVLYSWGLVECTGLGTVEDIRRRFAGLDVVGLALSNEGRSVVHTPQRVRFPADASSTRITHMHAGQWHSGAINDRGELFTWGVGYQGRLGHGDKEPAYTPKQVRGALVGHWVVDIACGSFHTVALTNRGAVFCWGDNASGQCGLAPHPALSASAAPPQGQQAAAGPAPEAVTSPYRVVALEFVAGGVARGVSCGRQHTMVVMDGPQPGCWEACCQLDDRGQPRGQHRQVYVMGEHLRTWDAYTSGTGGHSGHHHAPPDGHGTAGSGVDRRRASRATPPAYSVAPHGGRYSMTSDISQLRFSPLSHAVHRGRHELEERLDLDDDGSTLAPVLTCDGPVNSQFQRVPGVETLDVHRVVSGLHHTFVFAEAIRVAKSSSASTHSMPPPSLMNPTVRRFVSREDDCVGHASESSGGTVDTWAAGDMADDEEVDDAY